MENCECKLGRGDVTRELKQKKTASEVDFWRHDNVKKKNKRPQDKIYHSRKREKVLVNGEWKLGNKKNIIKGRCNEWWSKTKRKEEKKKTVWLVNTGQTVLEKQNNRTGQNI